MLVHENVVRGIFSLHEVQLYAPAQGVTSLVLFALFLASRIHRSMLSYS